MARFRAAAERAGKNAADYTVSVFGAPPKAEALERFAVAGIDRAILPLPPVGREEILPRLDRYAALID